MTRPAAVPVSGPAPTSTSTRRSSTGADARPFEVMLKPNGPRCNIDCSYCYYLDKEQYYPGTRKFAMSDSVLDSFVRQHIDAQHATGQREIVFAWQGGEPTLVGRDFYERAIELQGKYAPSGVTILNTVQTNGLLLDASWCRFFRRHDFLIGLSLDGPREYHDRHRLDRRGQGTFDKVMLALRLLKRYGVAFNVICVVSRHNAAHASELYRFFRKHQVAHLQFIPLVERSVDGTSFSSPEVGAPGTASPGIMPFSVLPRQYGRFLCELFDAWIARDVGRCFIQFFETQIGLWSGYPSSMCWFSEECGNALALEHNGDLYACDQYVYPAYRLGNITEEALVELASSPEQRAFGRAKRTTLPTVCNACDYRFACNGGCPKHRFVTSEGGEPDVNYFCEAFLRFFEHAGDDLRAIASLIERGLPAESIMSRQTR